jgi:hypothetical protein
MSVDLDEEERPFWFKAADDEIRETLQSSDISHGHWPCPVKGKGENLFCQGSLCVRVASESWDKLQKKAKSGESPPTQDQVKRTRAKEECICNHRRYCGQCLIWHVLSDGGKAKAKKKRAEHLEEQANKALKARIAKLMQ